MNSPNLSRAVWRKSVRSQPEGQNCVEIAALGDIVAVRDSKNPHGPKLVLGQDEWRHFTTRIKRDPYNLA